MAVGSWTEVPENLPWMFAGHNTGCGCFSRRWATKTNLTKLSMYNWYWCCGIGTYFTSTITILDPDVCTDTRDCYLAFGASPVYFFFFFLCHVSGVTFRKVSQKVEREWGGETLRDICSNTPQKHLQAWGSRRRLWSWKSPREEECVDICRCSVSLHCICCCEHFPRPSRPSALFKDYCWSRMKKKHQGMPHVSQVVHFPVNSAVGLEYNSILWKCDRWLIWQSAQLSGG